MSTPKHKDVLILWKAFMDGDEKAFTDVYYSFIDALWSYAKKLTNDHEMISDSLQEIFLDVYQKRSKEHIPLGNPKAYLFVALKNSILKKILKNKRFVAKTIPDELPLEFQTEYNFQDQLMEQEISEETRKLLQCAIQSLSPGQKEIIYLKFEEEFSYKEIAVLMKITVESARKQLYRALVSLREVLDKNDFLMIFLIFNRIDRKDK